MVEICAGIGGFSLAAEWMGWDVVGHVERDQFCQRVLKHHWPDAWHHDDLTTLTDDVLAELMYPKGGDDPLAAPRKNYDEAIRLYQSGFSIGEAASYFGISRQAMWTILKRRGVEMRPHLKYGEENHFYRGGELADDVAHNLVETAVQRGVLTPRSHCEVCGASPVCRDGRRGVGAHHDDYNKPLDVRWLCKTCHFEWHANHRPIRKEVMPDEVQRDAIDLVCGGLP